jgi:Acyl-CoA thioesterase C-terminal domain
VPESFYVPDGDGFIATELTRGPWDPGAQHAGPPSALLGRRPLLPGEEPSPLQRTLIAADVGNGISAVLDWRRHLFINVDLGVHLERMPQGEWVCVDAVTVPQENGIGTAEWVLFDERGRIGRAVQSLLLGERG